MEIVAARDLFISGDNKASKFICRPGRTYSVSMPGGSSRLSVTSTDGSPGQTSTTSPLAGGLHQRDREDSVVAAAPQGTTIERDGVAHGVHGAGARIGARFGSREIAA